MILENEAIVMASRLPLSRISTGESNFPSACIAGQVIHAYMAPTSVFSDGEAIPWHSNSQEQGVTYSDLQKRREPEREEEEVREGRGGSPREKKREMNPQKSKTGNQTN